MQRNLAAVFPPSTVYIVEDETKTNTKCHKPTPAAEHGFVLPHD